MTVSIGKSSLARAAAATAPRPTTETIKNAGVFRQVAVDDIRPLKEKKLPAADDDLTASIAAQGVLEPLLLAQTGPEELRLLCGLRRLAAARQAGLAAVPAVIVEMTPQAASAARREIERFTAAPIKETASVPTAAAVAAEQTTLGQAMPAWLL